MSRRIGFIAPVDHLSGNLSGDQVLKYAQNDNPAFDAPMGKQYARNYKTRYIGAIRASNGQPYFSVRTKNAVNISNRSKMVMALLGGTASVKQAIKKNQAFAGIVTLYTTEKIGGYTDKTLDKWMFEIIYQALETKEVMFSFISHTGGSSFAFHNPWVYTNQQGGLGLEVPVRIVAKFWMQLAASPIQFYVSGMKGVAHSDDTFANIIARGYNVLGLESSDNYVMLGNMYVNRRVEGNLSTCSTSVVPQDRQEFELTEELYES